MCVHKSQDCEYGDCCSYEVSYFAASMTSEGLMGALCLTWEDWDKNNIVIMAVDDL